MADKAEADRLAKEAADKAEAERLAKEAADKAEADTLAKEAAEKAEADRLAKEAALELMRCKLTQVQTRWMISLCCVKNLKQNVQQSTHSSCSQAITQVNPSFAVTPVVLFAP